MYKRLEKMSQKLELIGEAVDTEKFVYAGALIRDLQYELRDISDELEDKNVILDDE